MKKRLLALLLALVMVGGMIPMALAADGDTTTPPGNETVAGNTPTPLPAWEGITEDGHVLSGWLAPDGVVYDAGEEVTFGEETNLTALYGHAEIEKDLGEADTTAKGNTMRNDYQLTAEGTSVDPATVGAALDFSAITVNGTAVGSNVTKIEFKNVTELPDYDIMPSDDDEWRAVLTNPAGEYTDILYAREVGEGEANQVLACLRGDASSGYTITVYGIGGVSAPADSMGLFYDHGNRWSRLTEIDLSNFDTSNTWNMQNFFMGCESLATLDLTKMDTSSAENMMNLLYGCSALTSVDFSSFDTSKVLNMQGMLRGCSSLTTIDATPLETDNVQYMGSMFYDCSSLTSVDTTGWNTGSATSMSSMFRNTYAMTEVKGIETWDVSKVITFNAMFYMEKNTSVFTGPLDLSSWNPASAVNMGHMFRNLDKLTEINVSGWEMPELNTIDCFLYDCGALTTLQMEGWDVPELESIYMMVASCINLLEVDLSTWTNVNSMKNLYAAFSNCKAVTSIKIPGWTVVAEADEMASDYDGYYVDLYCAFTQCTSLTDVDMSGWTVGGPGVGTNNDRYWDARGIFQNTGKLETLDVSGWTIAEGTPSDFFQPVLETGYYKPQGAIWRYGGAATTGTHYPNWSAVNVIADNWDLNNVELNLSYLFSGRAIESLSGWTNIAGVADMSYMFNGCTRLTSVDLAGEAAKLTNVSYMFRTCTALTTANLTWTGIEADISSFTTTDMFNGCTALTADALTVSDDEYGTAIKGALTSAGTTARMQTAVLSAPAANVGSQTQASVVPAAVEETRQSMPLAAPLAEDGGASANEPVREDAYAVSPGQTVTYKLTVKYVGDEGAKSGVITVTDELPNGVTPVADTIKISAVQYSGNATSGYKGGKVTLAKFDGTTFTATIEGLYAGTEVDISFECTLSAVTPITEADGRYQYWDNTASVTQTEGPLTSNSNTLRLWYKDESPVTPPSPGVTYYIDASAGQGGSISPSGRVPVAAGDRQTFTISAGEGYVIANVLVDGVSVGQVSSYTFSNVRSNHTITVIFRDEDGVADPDDTGVSDWLDTDNHNAYLQGYGNNLFAPDANMTRAEVAQLFYNLLREKDVAITVSFDDVPAGRWYTEAVNTLASLGIIVGAGDGNFYPNSPITRAEFTAIAMRFTKGDVAGDVSFTDVSPSSWYYRYVVGAVRYGWIVGYGNGLFAPNASITRAEVTTIANRMLGRSADEAYVDSHLSQLKQFADVTGGWAYYQIMEATNSHTYTITDGKETWTGLS